MRVCELCPKTIPNWIKLDGKIRNLGNRKYCLKCSPFGAHNTGNPAARYVTGSKRTCSQCERHYLYNKNKGHSWKRCNSCVVNSRRGDVKKRALELMGGQCLLCGYKRCSRALGFHHTDPKKKDFGFGPNRTRAWKSLVRELAKCVLLCANCHHEVHEGLVELPKRKLRQLRLRVKAAEARL